MKASNRLAPIAIATACAISGAAAAGSLDPIFADAFESPEPGSLLCTPDNVQYPPAGYIADYSPTLEQLWYESTGEPVGGALAKIRLEGGTYTSMRFDRAMFGYHANLFTANGDTSNVGTGLRGADTRFIAISECQGDLRGADDTSPFEFMHSACRVQAGSEGPFMYINWGAPIANPAICNLDPAKTYYFSVIFDSPYVGYDARRLCSVSGGVNQCGFRIQFQ